MNKLLRFLFDIKRAYFIYNRRLDTDKRLDEIRQEFDKYDFTDGLKGGGILGDPLRDSGTILRLVRHYGIDLYVGTCYGDCRAVIEKKHWKNAISGPLIGRFLVYEHPDSVDDIYAFGRTVNEAVCKCLICAKTAGVI
jgi:hypothetical protein